jgi:hypothetical protein
MVARHYGLHLVFRIELAVAENFIDAQLKAYILTYEKEPKEEFLGITYNFDSLGNMGQSLDELELSLHQRLGKKLVAIQFS